MITPVECVEPLYDGYIRCPEEGELHRRAKRFSPISDGRVWNINIDDKSKKLVMLGPGLKLLWDT